MPTPVCPLVVLAPVAQVSAATGAEEASKLSIVLKRVKGRLVKSFGG